MSRDIRDVFTKVLPDEEPTVALSAESLTEAGVRRQRMRRIGYTGGAAAAAVAVILLLVQLPVGYGDAQPPAEEPTPSPTADPCQVGKDAYGSSPPMFACGHTEQTRELSESLREAVYAVAADVDFTASNWNGDPEPFELGSEFHHHPGFTELRGTAHVGDDYNAELVSASLFPPGDWEKDPGTEELYSRDTYLGVLISCWSGDPAETPESRNPITAACDEQTGPAGERVMTSYAEQLHEDRLVERSNTVLVVREDGTAVRIQSRCGIEPEMDGEPCDPIMSMDMLVQIALTAPTVPQQLD